MSKAWGMHGMRWLLLPVLAAALVFGAAGRAQAVEIKEGGVVAAGEVVNDDVLLSGNQVRMDGTVNGNLIASGADVTINGIVNGDVVVWSNTATINGTINGNLFLGGNTAEVNAPVKGTAYLLGYAVTLGPSAAVDRNVFFAGFSLSAQAGSKVGIDALVTGYQYLASGGVGRDVQADVAALELTGQVGRNVNVQVAAPDSRRSTPPPFFFPSTAAIAPVAPGLRVAETAAVGGKLTYTSSANQDAAIKAVPAGGQAFVLRVATPTAKPVVTPLASVGQSVVASIRDFLTLLALGALTLWLAPQAAHRAVEQARTKLLPAAGWGVVAFFAGYLALFVAGVTLLIVGILFAVVTFGGLANAVLGVGLSTLGAVAAVFSLLVAYGSKLVVALWLGQMVLRAGAPRWAENRFWMLSAGVLIYVVIRDVPLVIPVVGTAFGWLVGVAATVIGLGALWLMFREWWTARRSAVPAAPAQPSAPAAPAQL